MLHLKMFGKVLNTPLNRAEYWKDVKEHWRVNLLTLYVPTVQNGQTYSNISSAVADEVFECVWPVGA